MKTHRKCILEIIRFCILAKEFYYEEVFLLICQMIEEGFYSLKRNIEIYIEYLEKEERLEKEEKYASTGH